MEQAKDGFFENLSVKNIPQNKRKFFTGKPSKSSLLASYKCHLKSTFELIAHNNCFSLKFRYFISRLLLSLKTASKIRSKTI